MLNWSFVTLVLVKRTANLLVVLITTPNSTVARRLARALLQERSAACVNIIPHIESHFCWKGKIEKTREALLLIKTSRRQLPALERSVLSLHPYDTPEIVTLGLESGTRRYLAWLSESLAES